MARLWYASLEDVKRGADIAESARADAQIADELDAATGQVEGLLKRSFFPVLGTQYFQWPQDRYQSSKRLDLGKCELAQAPTQVVTGVGFSDTVLTGVRVWPEDLGAPYMELVLDDNANGVFERGSTPERSIAVTGLFCGSAVAETPVATTTGVLTLGGSTVTVTDGSRIGTGSVIRLDIERLVVTGRTWLDVGNLEPVTLAKNTADTSFTVTDGTLVHVGEELLLDAERMLITDIAADRVIVRRAVNGTTLAAHSNVFELFAQRTLTVERAVLGTAAVQHASASTVQLLRFPGLVAKLCAAEAQVGLEQTRSAYARVVGSGDNARESSGRGLKDLREQAVRRHGRRARVGAV